MAEKTPRSEALCSEHRRDIVLCHLNHPKIAETRTIGILAKIVARDLSSKLQAIGDNRRVVTEISRVDRAKFGGPDWNAWSTSVSERFDCSISFDIMIGRATEDVITKMMAARKPAYLYMLNIPNPIGIFRTVTSVASINPDDWQSGWMLVVK